MPEGPSIVILKEAAQSFKQETVVEATGKGDIDLRRIAGKKIVDILSFGKEFLICFDDFTVRIHFLLFGSYKINERKETEPRLRLIFKEGELNFYACSVRILEGVLGEKYDWSADIMAEGWSALEAMKKLSNKPGMMICDALLDQEIFAGVGNIIKNEVLYRCRVHPATKVGRLPEKKLAEIVQEARVYSFEFLALKKAGELKKHLLAHASKTCIRCDLPLVKMNLGRANRRAFFCNNCQVEY